MAKQKAPYKISKNGTVTFYNEFNMSQDKVEFAAMNWAFLKATPAEAKQVLAACTTKKALKAQFFPTKAQQAARQARFNANMAYVNNSREVDAIHRQMVNAPDFMPRLNK
jgi:hypothetical protein